MGGEFWEIAPQSPSEVPQARKKEEKENAISSAFLFMLIFLVNIVYARPGLAGHWSYLFYLFHKTPKCILPSNNVTSASLLLTIGSCIFACMIFKLAHTTQAFQI